MYSWARKHINGYEVSSRGDINYSAFNATMQDGRTIEIHYQCDVKGYDPGGTNWRLGKGKPPLNNLSKQALWAAYLGLWSIWFSDNPNRLLILKDKLEKANTFVLTDMFATTEINQANAISTILNLTL
jgi:hypothetical protein